MTKIYKLKYNLYVNKYVYFLLAALKYLRTSMLARSTMPYFVKNLILNSFRVSDKVSGFK